MIFDQLINLFGQFSASVHAEFSQSETYIQLGLILAIYGLAIIVSNRIRKYVPFFNIKNEPEGHFPLQKKIISKLGDYIAPVLAVLILRILIEVDGEAANHLWIKKTALTLGILFIFNSIIKDFVSNQFVTAVLRWVGMPILFLHLLDVLIGLIEILESISLSIGNIEISAYGIARVSIFGSLLFWLGRATNKTGGEIIRKQEKLDLRTREVAAKLFEIGTFTLIALLLLQVMGINLTALAVFGGAIGVGIGLGLQAIASNFISGFIILLDRSVSIGDYIELEDGSKGVVRQLSMRATTLETFDGKDIVVPNEKFIVGTFTNWTHKDKNQRYRVDFSVAYHSDIRELVEIIKVVVSSHPQVFSGDAVPLEERPDCEIDSFGDSGINMFVEFWMEGIDDGKNRVGGDLMLMILEALQQNGFEIPFPQREVRILNESNMTALSSSNTTPK
ncbi:MscS Mechanosensitive ion channel protein [Oleispira antarctica RB-8]|uniref:MscS Mechanosensitive ion channel protein n=1 Tax=Oleispira antarctica RB-8 TaxID=698738 RepID=R4YRI4_OLEAN|nr:MscS Mechanosensitive ion channel protein [Oleispira antarctica RB-8]